MKRPFDRALRILLCLAVAGPAFAVDIQPPPGPKGNTMNFQVHVLQILDGQKERWYFGSTQQKFMLLNIQDDTDGNGHIDPGSDGWRYGQSIRFLDMGTSLHGYSGPYPPEAKGTTAMGVVLSQPGVSYYNAGDGSSYPVMMYFGWQAGSPKPEAATAGEICLSFSDDGLSWTRPISAVPSGWAAAVPDCVDPPVPVSMEAVSGFHRTASLIHVFWADGDIDYLKSVFVPEGQTPPGTATYRATASPSAPHVLSNKAEVTKGGVVHQPSGSSAVLVHGIFINLDIAYDPVFGSVFASRLYAWPSSDTLCNTGMCPSDRTALPNRAQIYCLDADTAVWKTTHPGYSWQLLEDAGRMASTDGWGDGWDIMDSTCHTNDLLASPVLDSVDFESLNFVKTREGWLYRPSGLADTTEVVYTYQDNKKLACNTLPTLQSVVLANEPAGKPFAFPPSCN